MVQSSEGLTAAEGSTSLFIQVAEVRISQFFAMRTSHRAAKKMVAAFHRTSDEREREKE